MNADVETALGTLECKDGAPRVILDQCDTTWRPEFLQFFGEA